MSDPNDTTGSCCSTTLSIGRPGDRSHGSTEAVHAAHRAPDASATNRDAGATDDTVTTAFGVAGMTCGHCVASVTEEVGRLAGVTGVQVALVAGGVSTVTVQSAAVLDEQAISEAVDEAGYELADLAS